MLTNLFRTDRPWDPFDETQVLRSGAAPRGLLHPAGCRRNPLHRRSGTRVSCAKWERCRSRRAKGSGSCWRDAWSAATALQKPSPSALVATRGGRIRLGMETGNRKPREPRPLGDLEGSLADTKRRGELELFSPTSWFCTKETASGRKKLEATALSTSAGGAVCVQAEPLQGEASQSPAACRFFSTWREFSKEIDRAYLRTDAIRARAAKDQNRAGVKRARTARAHLKR